MSSSETKFRDGSVVFAKPKDVKPMPLNRKGKTIFHPAVVTDTSQHRQDTIQVAPISRTAIPPYKHVKEVFPSVTGSPHNLSEYVYTRPAQVSKSLVVPDKRKNTRVTPGELEVMRGLQKATLAKDPMHQELKKRLEKAASTSKKSRGEGSGQK